MSEIKRKPRIALMGEFSAGKSTLSNLMLGGKTLPERVTATRLSPVWMAHGTQDPYRIDLNGETEAVTLERLGEIPVEQTRAIRLFFEADILEVCDLIDFPGISDPNMSSDVWLRMLDEVDAVLWCTHATQAWRQSEAAVWDAMPETVTERSILLITRFDKLLTERDRARVLARVRHETKGQFAGVFPVSLTRALAAGDDTEAFGASGAAAFLEQLIETIENLVADLADEPETLYRLGQTPEARAALAPPPAAVAQTHAEASEEADEEGIETLPEWPVVAHRPREEPQMPSSPSNVTAMKAPAQKGKTQMTDHSRNADDGSETKVASVIPRRVRPKGSATTERPSARPPARPASEMADLRAALAEPVAELEQARG